MSKHLSECPSVDPRPLLRSYWVRPPSGAVDEIVERMGREGKRLGFETCAIHEVTRWLREHDSRPACAICHGRVYRNGDSIHELCRLREERGMETPKIDPPIECACSKCRAATVRA